MRKFTTLSLLTAAMIVVGAGSAYAGCSYAGIDVEVDGRGHVVELVDDGYGNQVTGRVFGKYNTLQADIDGDCNALVMDIRGRGTDVSAELDGDFHRVGVMADGGADVNVDTRGRRNTILADVWGGETNIDVQGTDTTVFVWKR